MNKQHIGHLIQEQTKVIAHLERQITTHEAIRLVLRDLNKHALTHDQALSLLQHEAERVHHPARANTYRQVIARLHELQVEDP